MKVQDVKKECLAITGLSVEFSNTEISSLSALLMTVTNAVHGGVNQAIKLAEFAGKPYNGDEEISVAIDLKTLKRIEWLLIQLTRRDTSDLFHNADKDYDEILCRANANLVEKQKNVKDEQVF